MNDQILEELKKLSERLDKQEERLRLLEQSRMPSERKISPLPVKERMPAKPHIETVDWSKLEFVIGKNVLQVLGVLLVICGALFFFKYSIEHGWISPLLRVLLGLALGTVLVVVSEYVRRWHAIWALASLAGGFIVYDISIIAAHQLYDLIGFSVAFGAMGIVSFAALYYAYRDNSQLLAGMSLLGGIIMNYFLDIPAHETHRLALLIYLFVLGTGVLIVSLIKQWFVLAIAPFFLLAGITQDAKFSYTSAYGALYALFLIFNLVPSGYALCRGVRNQRFEAVLVSTGLASFLLVYYGPTEWLEFQYFSSLLPDARFMRLISFCTGFGIFYGLEALVFSYFNDRVRDLTAAPFALCIGFFSAILVVAFTAFSPWIVVCHTLAVVFVTSWYTKRDELYLFAALIGLLPLYSFITLPFSSAHAHTAGLYCALAAIMLMGIFLAARSSSTRYKDVLAAGAALVPVFYWVVLFKNRLMFPYEPLLAAFYGSCSIYLGHSQQNRLIAFAGYGSVILSLALGLYHYLPLDLGWVDLLEQPPLTTIDYSVLFGGLTLIFTLLYFCLQRVQQKMAADEYTMLKSTIGGIVLTVLFFWIRMYVIVMAHYHTVHAESLMSFLRTHIIPADLLRSTDYRSYALTLYYAVTGLLCIVGGLVYKKGYIRVGGLLLIFLTLYKLWFLISDTLVRVVIFIVIGGILVGASYLYQRLSRRE